MTADCPGPVCVTCSDEAVDVEVVHLLGDALAEVRTAVGLEQVSVGLVDAQVGDVVLVHAGEAIAVLAATSAHGATTSTHRDGADDQSRRR